MQLRDSQKLISCLSISKEIYENSSYIFLLSICKELYANSSHIFSFHRRSLRNFMQILHTYSSFMQILHTYSPSTGPLQIKKCSAENLGGISRSWPKSFGKEHYPQVNIFFVIYLHVSFFEKKTVFFTEIDFKVFNARGIARLLWIEIIPIFRCSWSIELR